MGLGLHTHGRCVGRAPPQFCLLWARDVPLGREVSGPPSCVSIRWGLRQHGLRIRMCLAPHRCLLPSNRHPIPSNRRRVPSSRRQLPSNRRRSLCNRCLLVRRRLEGPIVFFPQQTNVLVKQAFARQQKSAAALFPSITCPRHALSKDTGDVCSWILEWAGDTDPPTLLWGRNPQKSAYSL